MCVIFYLVEGFPVCVILWRITRVAHLLTLWEGVLRVLQWKGST